MEEQQRASRQRSARAALRPTVFRSRALPPALSTRLPQQMATAHEVEPFSTTDPRATVRRVRALLDGLSVSATVFRGGLDLRGAEVDHVWLAVDDGSAAGLVLDVAFPLFDDRFVGVLRRFVAGDASAEDLDEVGSGVGINARVLGHFPRSMRYLGRPVWSAR